MPGPHAKNMKFQKPKNTKKTVSRLMGYLARRKWLLILVILMVLLSTAGMLSASYFIKILTDDFLKPMIAVGIENADFGALIVMLAKMGGLFAFSALASYGYARIMLTLSQSTVNTIRKDLFDAMQDLPISYFDTHTHGELMSRYTNDVDTVRNFLSQGFVQTISSLVSVIGTFAMMCVLSFRLTAIMLVFIAIMLLIIKKWARKVRNTSAVSKKHSARQTATLKKPLRGKRLSRYSTTKKRSWMNSPC